MDAQAAQAAVKKYDPREHARKKGMWAGLTSRCAVDDLLGAFSTVPPGGDPTQAVLGVRKITRQHTPALLKCFDEYLVNASDHAIARAMVTTQRKFSKVTCITVQFDPTQGVFHVVNDGPGIPIAVHTEISQQEGRPIYIPELAFCHMFSGSNLEKGADNVKGGTNGIGGKLGNIHSAWFRFGTVAYDTDGSQMSYAQLCRDHMKYIDPPEVVDLKAAGANPAGAPRPTPHTWVTMLPDYAGFGYEPGSEDWKLDFEEILGWLRLRCCQLAAYVGPKVQVILNGVPIPTTTATMLAQVYLQAQLGPDSSVSVFETQIKPKVLPHKRYPWNVVAVVSPSIRKFSHVTVINGVISTTGPHIKHLRDQFREAVLKKIQTTTRDKHYTATIADISKHMLLVVIGPLSGADWSGQRKDEVAISKETLAHYQLPATWCRNLAECLAGAILEAAGLKKSKVKRNDLIIGSSKPKGYVPAGNAGVRKGGKHKKKRKLLLSEGDSASTLLRAGLTLGPRKNPGGPTFEDYGIFCLYGVPMNASNFVTKLPAPGGGVILVKKKELQNNPTINALVRVLGLNWDLKYTTDAEMQTLRYDGVVLCVDGDVDGAGKIAGIMLMNFFLFWPALIARGFVQWFMTPVIRLYPASATTARARAASGPLKEFYLEQEFHNWAAAQGGGSTMKGVRYYKGLGSHDDYEIPEMFRNFEERLFTFALDEHAPTLFEVYFGDAKGVFKGKRKEELSTPQKDLTPELLAHLMGTRVVPCTVHLQYFVKPYKLEATERQLPGAMDGMTTVRRKSVAGARARFGSQRGGECQTFQLAGYVADKMRYHHAATSMENAIIRMCQKFPGSRILPHLIGLGAFGTWTQGGKDAASPRYTKVALNVDLTQALFPPADDCILPYVFVDGHRAEPKSYVPVICATAIDNYKIPSEGWAYNSWPRNPSQVIALTLAYCDPSHPGHALVHAAVGGAATPEVNAHFRAAFPLTVCLRGFELNLREAQGCIQHFGRYELHVGPGDPEGTQGCTIIVRSLPSRTWSRDLSDKLQPKEKKDDKEKKGNAPSRSVAKTTFIEDVTDYSGEDTINIVFKLKPGALATIKGKYGKKGIDPIEDFLELHSRFTSDLNVIRPTQRGYGGVLHFGNDYHALVSFHLPVRRRYYQKRYERQQVLLELEIRLEREILRYISLADELQISKIDDETAVGAALFAHEFPRIDHVRIRRPGYLSPEELKGLIVVPSSSSTLPVAEDEPLDSGAAEDEASDAEEGASKVRPSYNYILNLRERDQVVSARKKRQAKLTKLEAELKEVKAVLAEAPFPAASIWRADLAELERVLKQQDLYT